MMIYFAISHFRITSEAMLNSDDDEFALECLGIMGNLSIPDLDYELILRGV